MHAMIASLAKTACKIGIYPGRFSYPRLSPLGLVLVAVFAGVHSPTAAAPLLPPLTTVSGSPRLPGKFVWVDLLTDDVPRARTFYGGLFGWTFQTLGDYTVAANGEHPLCGMFQRAKPADKSAQPRWFGYISVPNVKRAADAAVKSGGRILAPVKSFPKRGEQAVFADPEGAVFGAIKSSSGDPEDFLAEPGDWIWIELLAKDARASGEFYHKMAGYDVIQNTTSTRGGDYVLVSEGYARAAALTLPKETVKIKPTWLLFVRVKDLSQCLTETTRLGGRVVVPPGSDLFDGRLAVIADPSGAALGLLQWTPESLQGGRGS